MFCLFSVQYFLFSVEERFEASLTLYCLTLFFCSNTCASLLFVLNIEKKKKKEYYKFLLPNFAEDLINWFNVNT